jgi:hypothetical protein
MTSRLLTRLDSPMVQAAIVALALLAVAAVMYEPNAIHGGFISDSWSNRSIYEFGDPSGGFFGGLSAFMDQVNIAVRPLLAVYLAGLNALFGEHMGVWLTWLVLLNVLMSFSLYLLLRRLSLSSADAGIVAVLVLLFPAASSLRFWAAMVAGPTTITLALLGFVVALHALEREGRPYSLPLHGLSLMLFAASLLLYELMLPLMLLSVLVYRLRVPWRPAIRRWLVDCGVLLTLALTVTRSSSSGFSSEGGLFNHARDIAGEARILFTGEVLPLASASWYVLLLLALVPAVAALVWHRLPKSDPLRLDLRRWLVVTGAGLLVAALGYAIFVPGLDYYVPLAPGVGNRVNAVAGIGWVLLLYGQVMLVSHLALQSLPSSRGLRTGFAALICALIAASWIGPLRTESDQYTRASEEDQRVLAAVEAAVPRPPAGSTIWTFGQPVEIASGIPVFANTWDMTGAVQLRYDDGSLRSYVAIPGTTFTCSPEAIAPGGPYLQPGEPSESTLSSSYSTTYFVDTNSGRAELLRTPAQCRRAARSFELSPAFPAG